MVNMHPVTVATLIKRKSFFMVLSSQTIQPGGSNSSCGSQASLSLELLTLDCQIQRFGQDLTIQAGQIWKHWLEPMSIARRAYVL
jgi:hypothetical protein